MRHYYDFFHVIIDIPRPAVLRIFFFKQQICLIFRAGSLFASDGIKYTTTILEEFGPPIVAIVF